MKHLAEHTEMGNVKLETTVFLKQWPCMVSLGFQQSAGWSRNSEGLALDPPPSLYPFPFITSLLIPFHTSSSPSPKFNITGQPCKMESIASTQETCLIWLPSHCVSPLCPLTTQLETSGRFFPHSLSNCLRRSDRCAI